MECNRDTVKGSDSVEDETIPRCGSNSDNQEATSSTAKGKPRKKRRLKSSVDEKVQKRLEANRLSAAASRQRRLDLVNELQEAVEALSKDLKDVSRENEKLRKQLEAVKLSNRKLTEERKIVPQSGPMDLAQQVSLLNPCPPSQGSCFIENFDPYQSIIPHLPHSSQQKQAKDQKLPINDPNQLNHIQQLLEIQQSQPQSHGANDTLTLTASLMSSLLSCQNHGAYSKTEILPHPTEQIPSTFDRMPVPIPESGSNNGFNRSLSSPLLATIFQQSNSMVPKQGSSSQQSNSLVPQQVFSSSNVANNQMTAELLRFLQSQNLREPDSSIRGQQLPVDLIRLLQLHHPGNSLNKDNSSFWKK